MAREGYWDDSRVVARAAAYKMPAETQAQLDEVSMSCTVRHVMGSLCGGTVKAISWWGCAWARLKMLCVGIGGGCDGLSSGWSEAMCERTRWGVRGVRGYVCGGCEAEESLSWPESSGEHKSTMSCGGSAGGGVHVCRSAVGDRLAAVTI